MVEFNNIHWDIIGSCEKQRKGKNLHELDRTGHLLCTRHTKDGQCGGVGFFINQKLKVSMIIFETIYE